MSDFGGEVMAEVLAERALVRPQIIPLVPLTNQYRHQDHMDLKDYKSKVSLVLSGNTHPPFREICGHIKKCTTNAKHLISVQVEQWW